MSRSRKILFWTLALLVVVAAALGWFFASATGKIGNVDSSEHIARNEALLDEIPVYPGGTYRTTWNIESKANNGWPEALGPTTSVSTSHVYRYGQTLDGPAVIDWYRSQLTGRCRFRGGSGYGDGKFFDATFYCGDGLVFVFPSRDTLEIRADFDRG